MPLRTEPKKDLSFKRKVSMKKLGIWVVRHSSAWRGSDKAARTPTKE